MTRRKRYRRFTAELVRALVAVLRRARAAEDLMEDWRKVATYWHNEAIEARREAVEAQAASDWWGEQATIWMERHGRLKQAIVEHHEAMHHGDPEMPDSVLWTKADL